MRLRLLLAVALVGFFALPSWVAPARPSLPGLPDRLVVALPDDLRPHAYLGEDGQAEGISVRFWRQWAAQRGVACELLVVPRAQALGSVRTGRADVLVDARDPADVPAPTDVPSLTGGPAPADVPALTDVPAPAGQAGSAGPAASAPALPAPPSGRGAASSSSSSSSSSSVAASPSVSGAAAAAARGARLRWGRAYAALPLRLFVRTDVPNITRLAELDGFRVGVLRNGPAGIWLRRHAPFGVRVVEYDDAAALAEDAFLGEVRAVVGAEANLSAQFGRMDLGGEFYVAEAPVAVLQLRVGAPARSAALLAVLDRDLGEVPGSLLQRSQNDWRGRPLAALPLAGLPWKGIGLAALALCGLVAGVMVWNWLLRRRVGRATGALRRANQALSAEIAERARAEGELAELNRRLEANVAERTADLDRKARELEAANLQLRQLDELKSEFLSSVSHELRTPLTSVRGFARLVSRDLERHFGPLTAEDEILDARLERVQSNLGVILDEGERLTRLIDDVLDLSRIEAGRMEWNDTDVDTSALLLKGARAAQGLFLNSPGVRFEVAIAPDLPRLRIDPDRLEQVLANLLGNAAKFTERGMVALSAWEQRGEIFVRVEDTGAGIPGEDLEHVFDKFRQSRRRASLTDKPQGTGLGLAICREIVEHYGGGIRAESEPGLGSAFLFRLPVPAPIAGTVSEPVHAPEAPDTEEPGTPKAGTDGSAAAIGPEAEAGSTVAAEPAAAEPAGTAAPGAPSGARGRKAGNGTWALAAEREREAGA